MRWSTLLFVGSVFLSSSAFANLMAMPSSVDFFNVREGSTSFRSVTLTNHGRDEVRVSVQMVGDFSFQSSNYCFSSLKPGQSCQIQVQFRPQREGHFSANLYIRGSNGSSTQVWLRGRGTDRGY